MDVYIKEEKVSCYWFEVNKKACIIDTYKQTDVEVTRRSKSGETKGLNGFNLWLSYFRYLNMSLF